MLLINTLLVRNIFNFSQRGLAQLTEIFLINVNLFKLINSNLWIAFLYLLNDKSNSNKMFNKLILTSFLLFSSLITVYPSKKENTNFFDYCYSLEKIISRNTLEKSNNLSKNIKSLAKDITLFGTNKTKGTFANKIIDQYKNSKNLFIVTVVPNQIYCLAGYWIEEVSPGKFESIFYAKTKQKINEYKNTKKEVDEIIKGINLEYKSIKKEINDFF